MYLKTFCFYEHECVKIGVESYYRDRNSSLLPDNSVRIAILLLDAAYTYIGCHEILVNHYQVL